MMPRWELKNGHETPYQPSLQQLLLHKIQHLYAKEKAIMSRRNPIGDSVRGVVNEIFVACGHMHVGQTDRCLNERVLEHLRKVTNNLPSSLLARHLPECNNCYSCCSNHRVLEVEMLRFR